MEMLYEQLMLKMPVILPVSGGREVTRTYGDFTMDNGWTDATYGIEVICDDGVHSSFISDASCERDLTDRISELLNQNHFISGPRITPMGDVK